MQITNLIAGLVLSVVFGSVQAIASSKVIFGCSENQEDKNNVIVDIEKNNNYYTANVSAFDAFGQRIILSTFTNLKYEIAASKIISHRKSNYFTGSNFHLEVPEDFWSIDGGIWSLLNFSVNNSYFSRKLFYCSAY